jgi:hypothetical protein
MPLAGICGGSPPTCGDSCASATFTVVCAFHERTPRWVHENARWRWLRGCTAHPYLDFRRTGCGRSAIHLAEPLNQEGALDHVLAEQYSLLVGDASLAGAA